MVSSRSILTAAALLCLPTSTEALAQPKKPLTEIKDHSDHYPRILNGAFLPLDAGGAWQHEQQRLKEASLFSRTMGGGRVWFTRRAKKPGTLILLRHGQSEGGLNERFTGWSDEALTEQGIQEIQHAARLIKEAGYDMDVVFTSQLKRAIHSTWALLTTLDQSYLPVFKSWRLSERSYGAVTGLSKADVAAQVGVDKVQAWRTNVNARPPPLTPEDPRWPGNDRRYADLENIPASETLSECMERTKPLWEDKIRSELENGHNVIVVGHGSTLRGLVKHIEGGARSDTEALDIQVPPGSPLVYEFDKKMRIIPTKDEMSLKEGMLGTYLDKPGLLQEAFEKEKDWKAKVPGLENSWSSDDRPMGDLDRALSELQAERELEGLAQDGQEAAQPVIYNNGKSQPANYKPQIITGHPCLAALPSDVNMPDNLKLPSRKDPVIVMIRHGKTEHNKLGLFTGWDDPPLAKEGVEEAKEAGKLLRKYGFAFDVVYSSWLSRAIETAWHIMDGLDSVWLPLVKSYRLNERMYGDLTNKSKKMIARIHGHDQFMKWRRGYKIRPPPVHSFAPEYPGNDKRYQKFVNDIRYSVSETLIRSVANKKFTPSRKLPKTESLHDCMKRTIPFLTRNIIPDAVEKDKRVLIASSENAIRGMLMHLCDIPAELISQLNIPNGVPLIYDMKSRTVKLLDDGSGVRTADKYDFGPAADYLFKSNDAGEAEAAQDESCDISEMDEETIVALKDLYKQAEESEAKTTAAPEPATASP